MTNASAPARPGATTVDPAEAAHFGKLAADWWDPRGSSAMLHRLNPIRLRYIRQRIELHWNAAPADLRPLAGKRALDVGCGAGLLSEPLARLGADVLGIDAAAENVAIAQAHAAGQGLSIRYRTGGIEAAAGGRFDLVTAMEVIEHVVDPAAFVRGLANALAPGGLLILSTPNRTPLSRLAMITLAEGLGRIPRGTHDWSKFLTPAELTKLAEDAGLVVTDVTGLAATPARGFTLSNNTALDYLVTAVAV